MKRKRLIQVVGVVVVLLLGGLLLSVFACRDSVLGEQPSPDGTFTLRYYKSSSPFRMPWSMPGDSACEPRRVRLFGKDGIQLNELLTTSCDLENQPRWLETELVLPDGKTIWTLPKP